MSSSSFSIQLSINNVLQKALHTQDVTKPVDEIFRGFLMTTGRPMSMIYPTLCLLLYAIM